MRRLLTAAVRFRARSSLLMVNGFHEFFGNPGHLNAEE